MLRGKNGPDLPARIFRGLSPTFRVVPPRREACSMPKSSRESARQRHWLAGSRDHLISLLR